MANPAPKAFIGEFPGGAKRTSTTIMNRSTGEAAADDVT